MEFGNFTSPGRKGKNEPSSSSPSTNKSRRQNQERHAALGRVGRSTTPDSVNPHHHKPSSHSASSRMKAVRNFITSPHHPHKTSVSPPDYQGLGARAELLLKSCPHPQGPPHSSSACNTKSGSPRAPPHSPSNPGARLPHPHDDVDLGGEGGGLSGRPEMFALPRDDWIIVNFMKLHTCYDLVPTSSKMVVFDTGLSVKKAFFALVYNGVRSAPLWDASAHAFVGMLTITDFINVLRRINAPTPETPSSVEVVANEASVNLEEQKIQTWRDRYLTQHRRPFLWVDPRANLLEAARLLVKNRVHRLPVVDPETGNALYILTHKRILRFLSLYLDDLPRPRFMDQTLEALGLGTLENVETLFEDSTIAEALDKFVARRISALPVIERSSGRVVDIYAKFDVINLAAERSYRNLGVSVKQALAYRSHVIDSVHSCQKSEKLGAVIDRIVKAGVHRLVMVDSVWHCVGMLSLSDILSFLIHNNGGTEHGSEGSDALTSSVADAVATRRRLGLKTSPVASSTGGLRPRSGSVAGGGSGGVVLQASDVLNVSMGDLLTRRPHSEAHLSPPDRGTASQRQSKTSPVHKMFQRLNLNEKRAFSLAMDDYFSK